jgi:ABC-type nitrate/sulfonate/bicarbonate transport system permease component
MLLAERGTEAAELADEKQRQRELIRIAKDELRINDDIAKFTRLRDTPDKTDLTVPSWTMLYRQGLVRSCTPQGSFARKEIWITTDFKATLVRLVTALVLGIGASLVLGMLMGCFDPLDAYFTPPFALLSKVPATAVLPIFFVMIQINFKLYLAIIIFGMLPSLAQSISASVRKDVPEELIFKAYTLGASQFELIWEVIFKQVLPRVLDAARLQIGPALVLLVAAEWMVAGEGIGYRLRLFYQRTDMTVVFVYVFILGVLGLATDYALTWTRRKLCPWFGD